jgi:hypothetical protein
MAHEPQEQPEAFPALTDQPIARIAPLAQERRFLDGEILPGPDRMVTVRRPRAFTGDAVAINADLRELDSTYDKSTFA